MNMAVLLPLGQHLIPHPSVIDLDALSHDE
jgi:hypothetical protein